MKQNSDTINRAIKEYKNSREKFWLLLREVISNSLHALIIRKRKDSNFSKPEIILDIIVNDDLCEIVLTDNGEGFTPLNSKYFNELDIRNPEKEQNKFHPLGQGRLALVYYADSALYESVYRKTPDQLVKRTFPYPPEEAIDFFSIDAFGEENISNGDTYTKLTIKIDKQQTLGRAKTFFNKYSDVDKFKAWIIETFFPFITADEQLVININYNGTPATIKKSDIDTEKGTLPFKVFLQDKEYSFKLWLIQKEGRLSGENIVVCFARNLKADLINGKIVYLIDSNEGYALYLTSEFFDENVDSRGEKIEISSDDIAKINNKLNEELDAFFDTTIKKNRAETKRNLTSFQQKYPSLDVFVQNDSIAERKDIVSESDLVKNALDEKGRIEKRFWLESEKEVKIGEEPFAETEEGQKLLNSSLQVYVKHRAIVLKRLEQMIHQYDEDGNIKPEYESEIHNLFLRRGVRLEGSKNINHLHNLWILDDKYTVFSNNLKALSTSQGQALSDIYIWADDPKKTKEILIVELKSTTKAHNAGSKEEGMIAQVKRYAKSFYKDPRKHINWDVNTDDVLYTGIIIANKHDINKELTSDSAPGNSHKIPFLSDSYYFDDAFHPVDNNIAIKKNIRIELYSFEDIHELASDRNEVFIKLLNSEYSISDAEEIQEIMSEQ